ncbi:MAG TPA: alpha/beta fold hydrolase [Chthoniobacterales bacterium]
MSDIAGIPFVEARFDKQGTAQNSVQIPAGTTDLFIVSHGWNNDDGEARRLYTELFTNFAAVNRNAGLDDRKMAIIGVFWPSKKFDERVAVEGTGAVADGGASIGAEEDGESANAVKEKLEWMKSILSEAEETAQLEEAKNLVDRLETEPDARKEFVEKIRSLLDPGESSGDDASEVFFNADAGEIMDELKLPEEDLGDDLMPGGGASYIGVGAPSQTEGAAGLTEFFSGFKASAMNLLNYTTYYVMKERAGTVGRKGVAPLIDQAARTIPRIHLVGHSFGGRLVTAAAANSTTDRIKSMTLLQAAFSHNGFSRSMNGFFRKVVDGRRVKGPIIITHTKNDRAVGVAYPIASRLAGQKAAALGDEKDVFGGIGRNGAQKMEPGETVKAALLGVGGNYALSAGKLFNLEASAFIKDHGDVSGREVAYAILRAIK